LLAGWVQFYSAVNGCLFAAERGRSNSQCQNDAREEKNAMSQSVEYNDMRKATLLACLLACGVACWLCDVALVGIACVAEQTIDSS